MISDLRFALNAALKGKTEVIEYVMACLLAGGHMLFDDMPGLGKTTLCKAIAAAVGGNYGRVQGTPDLLPSDITGFNVFNRNTGEFDFRRGPVFSDVLLADEINRATPRTQSALFEAMSENQVTIDGNTFPLAETFFVVATQNPVDHQGTFDLPEAQLDRFAMKLSIGYPDKENEIAILKGHAGKRSERQDSGVRAMTPKDLIRWRDRVAEVLVSEKIQRYLVDLAACFRNHKLIRNGLSPRALITWQRVAQANALIQGRDFVLPDDIQQVARPVLAVRIAGNFSDSDAVIDEVLASVECPIKGTP